ncbi:hypothetical protein ACU5RK_000416 [Campylobacter upsaliensis]|nr:glycosyltransferase family 4 protein [Campylobacter upsaliensis]EAI7279152.1 glycosyltransferase family 4 protein [Campylobacter upsaliensis]EAJ1739987.1 glycosyltransferase family 4 protein [Campylobacter upsaliensis]EAJ1955774.1 glycosyltransferase family 4 protein [Campylobacter upsaliensis]EAJ7265109.1 glycosyltransferase family 4 protein [Campylobacter upsaliensis]
MKIILLVGDITIKGGVERVVSNLANIFCEFYEVELLSLYSEGGVKSSQPFHLMTKLNFAFCILKNTNGERYFIS